MQTPLVTNINETISTAQSSLQQAIYIFFWGGQHLHFKAASLRRTLVQLIRNSAVFCTWWAKLGWVDYSLWGEKLPRENAVQVSDTTMPNNNKMPVNPII